MAIFLLFLAMHSLYLDEIDKFVYHVPHSDSKERSATIAAKETNKLERRHRFFVQTFYVCILSHLTTTRSSCFTSIAQNQATPSSPTANARCPCTQLIHGEFVLWNYYYYYDQHDTYYTQTQTHTHIRHIYTFYGTLEFFGVCSTLKMDGEKKIARAKKRFEWRAGIAGVHDVRKKTKSSLRFLCAPTWWDDNSSNMSFYVDKWKWRGRQCESETRAF